MSRQISKKPYWEMTTAELAKATAEFDQDFDESQFVPLDSNERAWWERAKSDLLANRNDTALVALRLNKKLLARCSALARKKRISRDVLIARGIKALLAAEQD